MKTANLGIDTSCYTTSVSLVDADDRILLDERKMLAVKPGQRGLRQSEAFYQHVLNLPGLFEKAAGHRSAIASICVSTQPRNIPDSYMPVFIAGLSFARSLSSFLDVPLVTCSHQDGHILSVLRESGLAEDKNFAVVHLSGGTAEILRVDGDGKRFSPTIIGGALDITAGQLIDRLGVRLGYGFPAGKALDSLVADFPSRSSYGISVKNGFFNLSGIENLIERDLSDGLDAPTVVLKTFNCIVDSLTAAFLQLGLKDEGILMTGGVSASSFLRKRLGDRFPAIRFGPARLCTDNAVGVARMGNRKPEGEAL